MTALFTTLHPRRYHSLASLPLAGPVLATTFPLPLRVLGLPHLGGCPQAGPALPVRATVRPGPDVGVLGRVRVTLGARLLVHEPDAALLAVLPHGQQAEVRRADTGRHEAAVVDLVAGGDRAVESDPDAAVRELGAEPPAPLSP